MVSEIELRKARWMRVMAGEPSPRHLLQVRCPFDYEGVGKGLLPRPELIPQRIERAWKVYQADMKRLEWLKDDFIPYLNCLTGTEIFAEAFGCRVHYPDDNMPFALPMVRSAAEAEKVTVPDLDAPPLKRMFDMADELYRRAGKGALVRPVDIQSPMDIAALIWEKGDLLMAMIEAPDAVKALAEKCRVLLTAFIHEWQRRYGREHIAHFPEYYMPYGMTLSEDEIGIVNNEMFDAFFLPHLVALSEHFGQIGIHCCADSQHQWKSFKKIPKVKYYNLKRELHDAAYAFFGDTHIIQQHGQSEPAQWEKVMQDHPAARLHIDVTAKSRDEALALVEKYRCE